MKTKFLSLLMAVVMVFSLFSITVSAESLTEVPDGYVGIYTKDDLDNIKLDMRGKYILMNDIVFEDSDYEKGGSFYNSGKGWEPIGTSSTPFCGTFDGNGYAIYNLKINNPKESRQGLFGYVVSAKINNVSLIDVSIVGYNYTGGICGTAILKDAISDCFVSGEITGYSYVGGICGYLENDSTYATILSKCINIANITAYYAVGGICGYLQSDRDYNGANETCYITLAVNCGNITGNSSVGGIVGQSSYFYNQIQNSYNTGNISGSYSGGIVGSSCFVYWSYSVGTSQTGSLIASDGSGYILDKFSYFLEDSVSDLTYINGKGKSQDQMIKQSTYEQWDFDTVWTMEGREDYPYPELRDVPLVLPNDSKTEITGTVTVKGEAKVGSTLTAEITDVTPADATFEYEWKADGKIVGTDTTYTVTQEDVGKNISLTIKGNGDFKGNFTSTAVIGECVHSVPEFTNNNNATCTKNETKTGVCEKCNTTVTEDIEDSKLSHTFITYTYDNNATCIADGTKTAKCENCDATDTVIAEKTMTEHFYIAEVIEPTCNENGEVIYTCSCGDSYSKTLYSAGHIDSDEDGICDECSEKINNCDCNCHKSGFVGFIWKIINFINKLFGKKDVCMCGISH